LLDVNVLLAIFDTGHVHYDRARAWWQTHQSAGWASCPLTQNGFARIISKPAYDRPVPLQTALAGLATQVAQSDHELWLDDISIADERIFDRRHILGPNQITDIYLLALAVRHGGRLVTFDRGVPLRAVRGVEARNLVVL
jgi:toxin-antitoxin system PIN domain toxin